MILSECHNFFGRFLCIVVFFYTLKKLFCRNFLGYWSNLFSLLVLYETYQIIFGQINKEQIPAGM